jgi:hypothetical protein
MSLPTSATRLDIVELKCRNNDFLETASATAGQPRAELLSEGRYRFLRKTDNGSVPHPCLVVSGARPVHAVLDNAMVSENRGLAVSFTVT